MKTEDFLKHGINRRQFLGNSAKTTAGVAAGMVGLSTATAAKAAPSERVRLAAIGIRNQGHFVASSMAGFDDVEIATICDVDASLLHKSSKEIEETQGKKPHWESDFRRVLDDKTITG